MDRGAIIEAALDRRGWTPFLRARVERLLDGGEDRQRLHCCDSGCTVCVRELLALLTEVERQCAAAQPPSGPAS